jgi:hypothetical protein
MGGFEHRAEHIQRGVEGVRGARSVGQAVGYGVEFGLGVCRQIGALGQVLPQQSVGVLAGSTLPRAMGVAEVDLRARAGREFAVASHLLALVVGQAVAHRRGYLIQPGIKARQHGRCRRVVHLGQQHQATGALHEHTHRGLVACALDEVSLPVARHDAVLDLVRTHVDAATVAQAGDELPAQLNARMRVDRRVDRLVGDVHGRVLGPHALEDTFDLLGRPPPIQHDQHEAPQDVVGVGHGRGACLDASLLAQRMRRHAQTRLAHARDRQALLRLKLAVGRSGLHWCTLPEPGVALHI